MLEAILILVGLGLGAGYLGVSAHLMDDHRGKVRIVGTLMLVIPMSSLLAAMAIKGYFFP